MQRNESHRNSICGQPLRGCSERAQSLPAWFCHPFAFFSLFDTSRLSPLTLIATIQRKRNASGHRFPWNLGCISAKGVLHLPNWSKKSAVLKGHKLSKCEDIPGSNIEWGSIEPELCGLSQRLLGKSEWEWLVVLAVLKGDQCSEIWLRHRSCRSSEITSRRHLVRFCYPVVCCGIRDWGYFYPLLKDTVLRIVTYDKSILTRLIRY